MKKFLKYLILTPIVILLLVFAFANRQIVTVSFDPFGESDISAFAVTAPLFVVLLLATMAGVIAGGMATWLSQGKYRKAARRSRAEAEQLRSEARNLRASQGGDGLVPSVGLQRHA